jgi:tetratricopeptide (TPR) repeat protein
VLQRLNKLLKDHALLATAILIGCAIYAKFLFYGHISWDDPEMVFKNRDVKAFDIARLFKGHYVGNYIPLTMLLHAIGWGLFENSHWGHHLLNILLHVINGVLVFRIGQKLFKSTLIANTGAIIFLLHPLQVESVGWISELKNVLSTALYLYAFYNYLLYTENRKTAFYLSTLLLFLLGCLSKSSVVVFPLVLIVFDFFMLRDFSMKSLLNKIPFLFLSLFFGFINIKTQTADLFINHAHEFPYYQRTGFAGYALFRYLLLYVFPFNLSVIYPYPNAQALPLATGFIVLLTLGVAIFLTIKKRYYTWAFLILFVLLNLALVLQFLPFGEVLYADRYAYIPVIGLAWMTGLALNRLSGFLLKTVSTIAVCFIVLLTFIRCGVWSSGITLYKDILRNFPNSFVALNSVGVEYMYANDDSKALFYLNKAVSVAPYNYKGFYNRGLWFIKNNKPQPAIKNFNDALALYDYPKAYVGRASAYYMEGDLPKAMSDAGYVLGKDNGNAKAHFVMGNCYNDMNRLDDAMNEYNKCIELSGEEADYYFKRAIVYGKKQDFISCLNDLDLCTSLNSNLIEAYYWKGVAKVNLRQDPCSDFRRAAQNNYEPAVNAYHRYCR